MAEIPSAAPCGGIEIAADATGGKACSIFLEPGQPIHEPAGLILTALSRTPCFAVDFHRELILRSPRLANSQ